jgi:general secretion pathway protein K
VSRARGHAFASRATSRGIAFVLVLWVIAMLAILLGSFSLIARTENLQSRHLFDTTQARYAAEAGLNLAVYELRKQDPAQRWVGDGRPYRFGYGDAEIEVSITDDSGKIDINAAANNPDLLVNLFITRGVDLDKAQQLSDSIQDWIDSDDNTRPNGAEIAQYKAAGLSYGPKNAPFDTVSELQQVLGMTYDLYEKIEPGITIYSGRSNPTTSLASPIVLQALYPDASPDQIQQFVQALQSQQPGQQGQPVIAPDGTPVVAGGGGLTYSVKSRAKLPNGASTVLDATIRMGGVSTAGRPFVILRWRDGETS